MTLPKKPMPKPKPKPKTKPKVETFKISCAQCGQTIVVSKMECGHCGSTKNLRRR